MSYPWTTHIDHDAFDVLDLSNGGRVSGQVGCMVRRLDSLWRREKQLIDELAQVRAARDVAMAALDRFIAAEGNP